VLVALALGFVASAAAAAETKEDLALRQRIAEVRAIAERIRIDGDDSDWAGIPRFTGSAGRTDDPSRHIVAVAIAPRRDDLLVMLRTAGRPSREDRAFWIGVDFTGAAVDDIQIGIRDREPHVLWVWAEGEAERSTTVSGIEHAIGDVVEIRIPHAALARALPKKMAEALTTRDTRSWVRVTPLSWNARTREFVSYGAAVASFRLALGDAAIDPPLPRAATAARAVPLPLTGQWRVCQGAYGIWTHQGAWAYDLDKVDATLHPSSERFSKHASDYFSWNQPVFVPVAGTVIRSHRTEPDNPARTKQEARHPNELYLDIGGGVGLSMLHFMKGSPTMEAGSRVAPGAPAGRIGHSGSASWPHLHIGLWRYAKDGETLPMAFARVRVGLNPGRDDPWARDLESWDIREGFFVQSLAGFP
jgi:hypothetical protein